MLRSLACCNEGLFSIAVDPQGTRLACLYQSGRIEMRSLHGGRLLWTRAAHGLSPFPHQQRADMVSRVLCFSPDGRDLVTATSEEVWVLAVWDVRSGERVQALRGHDKCISGATYLPDGTLVSWGFDGTLRFWDVPRGFARQIISLEELLSC
jgi:WD40 repeat protein